MKHFISGVGRDFSQDLDLSQMILMKQELVLDQMLSRAGVTQKKGTFIIFIQEMRELKQEQTRGIIGKAALVICANSASFLQLCSGLISGHRVSLTWTMFYSVSVN